MLKPCPDNGEPCRMCLPERCSILNTKWLDRRMKVDRLIHDERRRQDEKWGWPNAGLAGHDNDVKYRILGEEVGEVAHALNEQDIANLHEELIQVAAVCIAWLEHEIEAGRL